MHDRDSIELIVNRARVLSAEERIAFLNSACSRDPLLLAQVNETLDSSQHAWWSRTGDDDSTGQEDEQSQELVGSLIGKYRVTALLGAGGMGRVVLAERADDQFRHQVAIKLVRSDLVSRQVQNRLKIERQILATLDHPNIAKLLDGGTFAGVPYIVMEYVEGKPIDVYCNEHRLSVRDRLALFRTVCSAVHYAHQNLIVHRDLKPSNILVTPDGIPKLLDFGIAKLLDSRSLAHTMAMTHMDVRLMTPDHASPEQVRGEPITTASDIYVLGVLLYELLTDRKPLTAHGTGLGELQRAICELEPAGLDYGLRSDARLPTDFLDELCGNRDTTPGKLRKELSGDLQSIVSMALRKEPERRYSSVEQFSDDIARYLQKQPILARRDTWTYRTRKFIGRHTFGVAVSVAAIAALAVFSIAMGIQAQRIANERTRAEEVSGFLVDVFEQADPAQSRGQEITVKQLLDSAAKRMSGELVEQPTTKARLMTTLGTVYGKLGNYADAEHYLREALALRVAQVPQDSTDVADLQQRLANVIVDSGALGEADTLLEASLATNARHFGRQSLQYGTTLHTLARLRRKQEQLQESERLHEECARILEGLDPVDPFVLTAALIDWAVLLDYRKDFPAAESVYRKALELSRSKLGPDHPLTAQSMHGLAASLAGTGRMSDAHPLYAASVEDYRRILGDDHPQTMQALANYGTFLRTSGHLQEAESVLRGAIASPASQQPGNVVRTAYVRVSLGFVLVDTGRPQAAQREFESALETYAAQLPEDHLYVASAQFGLGRAQLALRRPAAALEVLDIAAAIASRHYSEDNAARVAIAAARGGAFLDLREINKAEPLLLDAYPRLLASRGADDAFSQEVRGWILKLYEARGARDRGEAYLASVAAR